jgi:uncharacterized protein (TIGR02001 family)
MAPTSNPAFSLHRLTARLCAAVFTLVAGHAQAELQAYATIASEYVYRGHAVSDREPSLQAAFDYQHRSGLFAGAWAGTIRIDNNAAGRRRQELDYYLGYHFETPRDWTGAITLMRYSYPGARGPRSYDYSEWLASAEWSERVFIEVAYSPGVYGSGRPGRHLEIGARHTLPGGWILSGSLGRNDLSALGVRPYLHWDFGSSATFSRFTVDLRWYDSESFYSGGYGGFAAGSRVVVSLSTAF